MDEWLCDAESSSINPDLVNVIRQYRDLFVDKLSDGLSPPRVLEMTSFTVPDAIVPRGGTPRFTQPEAEVIRNTLQVYLRKMDPTEHLPICLTGPTRSKEGRPSRLSRLAYGN